MRAMLSRRHEGSARPEPVTGFENIACNWDQSLGHWAAKILPGEFYITRSREAIIRPCSSNAMATSEPVLSGVTTSSTRKPASGL